MSRRGSAPAAGGVHWHIARLVVDAAQLGSIAGGAVDAALNVALTERLAGAHGATPRRGETTWVGAVADALAERLPPTSSGTQAP